MSALVERMARSLYGDHANSVMPWDSLHRDVRSPFLSAIRRVLAEAEAAGWRLVPAEPTPDMTAAGKAAAHKNNPSYYLPEDAAGKVYQATLAAAPKVTA